MVGVGRPLEVLGVPAGPVVGHGPVEHLDEAARDLPAAVPALVDDERGLVDLAEVLPDQVVLAVDAGVGHVDVADLALGLRRDVGAVLLDPLAVAEVRLAAQGLDHDVTGIVVELRLLADGDRDRAARQAHERGPRVLGRVHGHAVDGQEVVALLDVDAGLPQRVAGVHVPGRPLADALDPVGAVGQLPVHAEHADGLAGLVLHVAAEVVGVADVELRDHLPDDVAQVLAGHAVVEHLLVVRPHGRPVHAVHVGDVEVVALEPPRLDEELPPLLARVDGDGHARRDHVLAGGPGRRVLDRPAPAAEDDDLLAVGRHLVAAGSLGHRLLLLLLVGDVEEHDLRRPPGLEPHVQELVLVVDGQIGEAAG